MFHGRNLTNLRSVRSTCEEDLKVLEATIAALINSNSTLREENAKLNAEISVLGSNLNNLQADLNAYNDIISNLNLTIEDLRGQITSLMNENSKLQADLNAANTTISSLNSQINSLNSQITTLTNDKNSLTTQLNSANTTISSLNSQLSFFNQNCQTLYDPVKKKFYLKLGEKAGNTNSAFYSKGIYYDIYNDRNNQGSRNLEIIYSKNTKVISVRSDINTEVVADSPYGTPVPYSGVWIIFSNINNINDLRTIFDSIDPNTTVHGSNEIREILRFLSTYCTPLC